MILPSAITPDSWNKTSESTQSYCWLLHTWKHEDGILVCDTCSRNDRSVLVKADPVRHCKDPKNRHQGPSDTNDISCDWAISPLCYSKADTDTSSRDRERQNYSFGPIVALRCLLDQKTDYIQEGAPTPWEARWCVHCLGHLLSVKTYTKLRLAW